MKKAGALLFSLGLALFFSIHAQAQTSNQHSIGGRFGSSTGFTYRYTSNELRALEAIVSMQSNSKRARFRLTGLYQYVKPLTGDFNWYYGFGGSIGSFKEKSYLMQTVDEHGNPVNAWSDEKKELSLSIDGIVGIEYNIPTAPLTLSLDVKPYFDFLQESTIKIFDPIGFSIRYRF